MRPPDDTRSKSTCLPRPGPAPYPGGPMRRERPELQRHADYFDPEGTGYVRVSQTYRGLRDLGVSRPWSALLSAIINGALGYVTQRKVTLTIAIEHIARGKHASDTGIFDENGRFVPARFDALFASAAPDERGAEEADEGAAVASMLTRQELRDFMHADGPQGFFGDLFSAAEAKLFFCVASDAKKKVGGEMVDAITRRRLRSFYRGDLLPALRRRYRIEQKKRNE